MLTSKAKTQKTSTWFLIFIREQHTVTHKSWRNISNCVEPLYLWNIANLIQVIQFCFLCPWVYFILCSMIHKIVCKLLEWQQHSTFQKQISTRIIEKLWQKKIYAKISWIACDSWCDFLFVNILLIFLQHTHTHRRRLTE